MTPVIDYREEVFAASDGGDGPFWVSVEASDGTERSPHAALGIVTIFHGSFEDSLTVEKVMGRVENGYEDEDDWRFVKDPAGAMAFWEVDG